MTKNRGESASNQKQIVAIIGVLGFGALGCLDFYRMYGIGFCCILFNLLLVVVVGYFLIFF